MPNPIHFPPIILTGARCSGKSTVAETLAALWGLALYDTDAIIVAQAGCPVAEVIAREGWEAFRERESEALAFAIADSKKRRSVIATGGGIVLAAKNRHLMKDSGIVFFLDASLQTLQARMTEGTNAAIRPALHGKNPLDEIAAVLEERLPLYLESADVRLEADRPLADIVQNIATALQGKGYQDAGCQDQTDQDTPRMKTSCEASMQKNRDENI